VPTPSLKYADLLDPATTVYDDVTGPDAAEDKARLILCGSNNPFVSPSKWLPQLRTLRYELDGGQFTHEVAVHSTLPQHGISDDEYDPAMIR